jgi:hypothetical protein
MDLGSDCSLFSFLANKLANQFSADSKAPTNSLKADSASFIRGHNPFSKIQ